MNDCFYCQGLKNYQPQKGGKCAFCGKKKNFSVAAVLDDNSHEAKPKEKPKINDIRNGEKLLMPTKKPTPEEIIRKKEYVRFLNTQIYKLTSQHKYLTKQLTKLEAQLKDYEKEKEKIEKWLKEN
ncbi:4533_t:CDS:2 [Entrophospora sp. SA101]|nr:6281_t:CDS:2 [Entrophospora sp. SA101]CAJ0760355.1 4522_t:CDS:2 [Entrophospora sp. SA101]CAJ0760366.1 4533_t:CDS:2 [Entrophospora sp. SA101]CAJ0842935.1 13679_t:CDS:2 [Entrophospora sp. SA101]